MEAECDGHRSWDRAHETAAMCVSASSHINFSHPGLALAVSQRDSRGQPGGWGGWSKAMTTKGKGQAGAYKGSSSTWKGGFHRQLEGSCYQRMER